MPNVGQTTRTRWVDTGSELQGPDDHVYLSEIAVTEAARLFGWVPGGELRQRTREIDALNTDLRAARAEVAQLRHRLNAVDVLESEGFTARKKPGRPPKIKEEAVA